MGSDRAGVYQVSKALRWVGGGGGGGAGGGKVKGLRIFARK